MDVQKIGVQSGLAAILFIKVLRVVPLSTPA
jgi:hypothetical protein